jgi:quinolinate synthase
MSPDAGPRRETLSRQVRELARSRDAIILAHNYQIGEVQDVADFIGDSLELSQRAAKVGEGVIVFCGVHFMAETAAILSPDKTVLLPHESAGCPMADMITAGDMAAWKARYPGRPVVSYVNTSAAVKAESDVCCTSANAVRVVESLPDEEVLFAPDRNLAAYVARFTKKRIIPWDGYCHVHQGILPRHVRDQRALHPDAEVWAHPECRPEVIDLADKTLSTGQMMAEARKIGARDVIVATESGILYRLAKENPEARFFAAHATAVCPNMKKINLRNVHAALDRMVHRVTVPSEVASRARGAIERMIHIL